MAQRRLSRPKHYDQYADIPEIVPGVFVEPGDAVYIVDAQGEVCSWNADEWQEDPEAVTATVSAVILAATLGAAACRENLKDRGTLVEGLIRRTRRLVGQEPQEVEGCHFVDNGVDGHVTLDGKQSIHYHLHRSPIDPRQIIGINVRHVPRTPRRFIERARQALSQRYGLDEIMVQARGEKNWGPDWKLEIKFE